MKTNTIINLSVTFESYINECKDFEKAKLALKEAENVERQSENFARPAVLRAAAARLLGEASHKREVARRAFGSACGSARHEITHIQRVQRGRLSRPQRRRMEAELAKFDALWGKRCRSAGFKFI